MSKIVIVPIHSIFLRKKNRAFKSFIRKSQPDDMLEGIQNMIARGSKLVEDARNRYFFNIGRKLSGPSSGTKIYWSVVNKILNKAKIPEIPPLLENDIFVLDFASKAQIFNDYFILQCTALDTGSEIPVAVKYQWRLVVTYLWPQPNFENLSSLMIKYQRTFASLIRTKHTNGMKFQCE